MEVTEIFKLLDFSDHQRVMELLFPHLTSEIQLDLINKFKFKYNNDDYTNKSQVNIFEFIKGIDKEEISKFMNRIQCPLLLLNYINYKLDDEINLNEQDPAKSYALELLYLFNDFLTNDYYSLIIGTKFQKICKWGRGQNYQKMRKHSELSNFSDISSSKKLQELNKIYCHNCFGRQKWHELSMNILELFIIIFENWKTTCNLILCLIF